MTAPALTARMIEHAGRFEPLAWGSDAFQADMTVAKAQGHTGWVATIRRS